MFDASWLAVCLVAQILPAGPIETAGGTVSIGGEVSATVGARDDDAFFNYTDYEHNALRFFRISLTGTWRPSARLAVLTDVRSENGQRVIPYALYVRVRPWKDRRFDVQAGRIPPVFGTFARRSYVADNPLIGYPLAYQYLTALRSDAVPANADDLLQMRARGWRLRYPVGDATELPGVPIVSAYRWDTGVQAQYTSDRVDLAAALTSGTLSRPRVRDDNGAPQISGRAGFKPVVGLVLGASFARGEFVSRSITGRYEMALGKRDYTQQALGFDGEYSRGYWIVRGEAMFSRWTVPRINVPFIDPALWARSGYVEGRYRFTPRVYAAARVDYLGFSSVRGQRLFSGAPTSWDAPVSRVEAGGGVFLQRNLTARAVVQRNWRDAGRVRTRTFLSAQLAYWF
jgi:hypothetical protein